MKRKNTLLLNMVGQSCLLSSIGKLLLWLSLGIGLVTGCDLDRDRDSKPPVIRELTLESPINIQKSINVTAVVPVNEDPNLQYEYDWSVTGGEIKENGVLDTGSMPITITDGNDETHGAEAIDSLPSVTVMATYIAPETPGIYTITLKVCTRYAVVEKSCNVEVTNYIIKSSPRVYWEANKDEELLQFDVEAIRRAPILLRYKIERNFNREQTETNLIVCIDEEEVSQQKIGSLQSLDPLVISDEIDVTQYINTPRAYNLKFMLKTMDIKENVWLLKSVQIVGVEGAFFP